MLPNLIIVGAPKCGTTSLHAYLDQHPEICMSQPKELRYFMRSDWRAAQAWYESHFDEDAPVRGESSPAYSLYPAVRDIPERMHVLIPHAKLVYLVRDPIERIRSHCVQRVYNGLARSSEEALEELDRPDHRIVCGSRYATQLERYLALFDASQILVLDQQDLDHRPAETLARVFRFLEVDETFTAAGFAERRNTGAEKYVITSTGARLWAGALGPVGRAVLPASVRERIRRPGKRLLSRRVRRPDLQAETLTALRSLLDDEAKRFRTLTGQPFESWSI